MLHNQQYYIHFQHRANNTLQLKRNYTQLDMIPWNWIINKATLRLVLLFEYRHCCIQEIYFCTIARTKIWKISQGKIHILWKIICGNLRMQPTTDIYWCVNSQNKFKLQPNLTISSWTSSIANSFKVSHETHKVIELKSLHAHRYQALSDIQSY